MDAGVRGIRRPNGVESNIGRDVLGEELLAALRRFFQQFEDCMDLLVRGVRHIFWYVRGGTTIWGPARCVSGYLSDACVDRRLYRYKFCFVFFLLSYFL